MKEKVEEQTNPLAHLPQHVQDAFNTGGSVRVGEVICTSPEQFVSEIAKEAEQAPAAAPTETIVKLPSTAKEIKALEAEQKSHAATKEALETEKSLVEKLKSESTTQLEAIKASGRLLGSLIPKTSEELKNLPEELRSEIATVYEVNLDGLDESAALGAIIEAVHG